MQLSLVLVMEESILVLLVERLMIYFIVVTLMEKLEMFVVTGAINTN